MKKPGISPEELASWCISSTRANFGCVSKQRLLFKHTNTSKDVSVAEIVIYFLCAEIYECT